VVKNPRGLGGCPEKLHSIVGEKVKNPRGLGGCPEKLHSIVGEKVDLTPSVQQSSKYHGFSTATTWLTSLHSRRKRNV